MKYYVYVNEKIKDAADIAFKAISVLNLNKEDVYLNDNLYRQFLKEYKLKNINTISKSELNKVDIIITVGGDGTTINVAKNAIKYNKPILSINAGHKGFLAGVEAQNLNDLRNLAFGKYTQREVMVLKVKVKDKSYFAINDVVLDRDNTRGVIDLTVFEKNSFVIDYKADAVLISTPLGSTGYAFSNGGPIADYRLNFISMAPICPHSFNSRPYIFRDDAKLRVRVGNNQKAYLLVDGREVETVSDKEEVEVYKSDYKLKLIYINNKAFYETVRLKFKEI